MSDAQMKLRIRIGRHVFMAEGDDESSIRRHLYEFMNMLPPSVAVQRSESCPQCGAPKNQRYYVFKDLDTPPDTVYTIDNSGLCTHAFHSTELVSQS